MSLQDTQGLSVSSDDPEIVGRLNEFDRSFLSYGKTAAAAWEAAERAPGQPLVAAKAAALALFMQTGDAAANATRFLDRAEGMLATALPRERLWHQAVRAWAKSDLHGAIGLHERIVREFPRDLAAMKLGQVHQFHIGDAEGMLRLAELARPANEENPYLHGMRAFALEECHHLDEAEASARQAIAMLRREPWAHHALAHVMEAQGRAAEGLETMLGFSDCWADCNSFMLTHNWWHAALFAIDCDDPEQALALYDQRVWGVWKEYSQDQVNAVALLARLEFVGLDAGGRWQDLAQYLEPRLHEHVDPFLDLHYLLGLARAGYDASAQELLTSMAEYSHVAGDPVWHSVALPLGRGILAYGRQQWDEAFRQLRLGLEGIAGIGGSHAQRDLFHWLMLEAGWRAGRGPEIRPLLQLRVAARPGIARHRRELARIDSAN
ncbi:MAG: tetratricopeptide repeat protein [Ferrovibrio sp.]|nr:tetratricopeptide repeat protein [Ferrovibrio sp.]